MSSQLAVLEQELKDATARWDFPKNMEIFKKLCVLEPKWFVTYLIWLADASFLEELSNLINEKQPVFFEELAAKEGVTDSERKAVRIILWWHKEIYVRVQNHEDAPKATPLEQEILSFVRDKKFEELKKLFIKERVFIFRQWKSRQMVSVFALNEIARHGHFTEDIRKVVQIVYPGQLLRARRLCLLLDDYRKSFFNTKPVDMVQFITLLTQPARAGEAHGNALVDELYAGLKPTIEYEGSYFEDDYKKVYHLTSHAKKKKLSKNNHSEPRVAVCIAGQTRGSNEQLVNLLNNVVIPTKADVFLSTWDTGVAWQGVLPSRDLFFLRTFGRAAASLVDHLPLDNLPKFKKLFPNLFSRFGDPIKMPVDISFYTDKLPITGSLIENEDSFVDSIKHMEGMVFKNSYNQAKMFYKNYSVMQLVLDHEAKNNFKYDYIIKIRQDLRFTFHTEVERYKDLLDDTIYLFYSPSGYGPDDAMWLGTRESMLKMCAVWPSMLQAQSVMIFKGQQRTAHYLTAMWISKMGMTTRPSTMLRNGGITLPVDMGHRFTGLKAALAKDLEGPAAEYAKNRNELEKFVDFIENPPQV